MSLRNDGHYHCDGCGHDLGTGGGVAVAAIISDTEPDNPSAPRRLDLCRTREEEGKRVKGCRDRVFTKRALRDLAEYLEASE